MMAQWQSQTYFLANCSILQLLSKITHAKIGKHSGDKRQFKKQLTRPITFFEI